MSIRVEVAGVSDCLRAFSELPQAVQNRQMRIGLNAAAGVIRDAAKSNAPRETGLLRRSLKIKVRVPNASYNRAHHGRPAYAVIGPARRVIGLATTAGGKTRGGIKRAIKAQSGVGTVRIRRPSRYAHLVEKGTRRGVTPKRFLARAVSNQGEAAKAKMLNKIRDGVMNWARGRRSRALAGVT